MKVFLCDRTPLFRGKRGFELDLLGKSASSHMRSSLGFPEGSGEFLGELPVPGEKLVFWSAFPFLKRDVLLSYLRAHGGSFRFEGGEVVREREPVRVLPPPDLGLGDLGRYRTLLVRAERESAEFHAAAGALVEEGCAVSFLASLGRGVAVRAGARVLGASCMGENSEIFGGVLEDSSIGKNCVVRESVLLGAEVGDGCRVGPFAYLRPKSRVGSGCRIGDFVELKSASVGAGGKISHLAYVGDAELGEKVNVGCGVVFANYDGKRKSRTRIGDGCFLGSNCNLIAPVTVGDGAFIAAGTTLTRDLNADDFCIGRCRETVKPGRGRGRYDPN